MKKDVYQRRARKPFPWTRDRERTVAHGEELDDRAEPPAAAQQDRSPEALREPLRQEARRPRGTLIIALLVGLPITALVLWMVLRWVDGMTGGTWGG